MLSTAHLTMAEHFDMDELIQHLVTQQGNKGKTRVCFKPASRISNPSAFLFLLTTSFLHPGLYAAPSL